MSEWQTMENAPKDGSWVLLYWPDMAVSEYPLMGFWDDARLATNGHYEVEPTHWQPFLQPPPLAPQK